MWSCSCLWVCPRTLVLHQARGLVFLLMSNTEEMWEMKCPLCACVYACVCVRAMSQARIQAWFNKPFSVRVP